MVTRNIPESFDCLIFSSQSSWCEFWVLGVLGFGGLALGFGL